MLVDFATMQTIVPQISPNNEKKFDPISQQTEDYYLPKYLGRSFAYDVQQNPANYTDLLDGVEFLDCDGNTIKFKGLKYVMAFFIYAEYINVIKYTDSFTGVVTKNRNDAFTTSQGQEEKLKIKYRKQAESEVEVMHLYLDEESDSYPLWDCKIDARPYTPRFTAIKKTK